MSKAARDSGIGIVGELSWGAHLCQFCATEQDMLEIGVPYIRAGLLSNELCVWVALGEGGVARAASSLRARVPDLDSRISCGQLEMRSHSELYLAGGAFDPGQVLSRWSEMAEQAQRRGYEGLRVIGSAFWLTEKDWQSFADYERSVQRAIGERRMLALCAYPLELCGAVEVMEVASSHSLSLIRKGSEWAAIESMERRFVLDAIREGERRNRALTERATDLIFRMEITGDGSLATEWLAGALEGLSGNAWKTGLRGLIHPEDAPLCDDTLAAALSGRESEAEVRYLARNRELRWIRLSVRPEYHDGTRIIKGILGRGRDITGRKRAEQRLLDEMSLRDGLIDSLPGLFYVVNEEGRLIRWNSALEALTGCSAAEISRMELVELFAPGNRQRMQETIRDAFRGGSIEAEAELQSGDGRRTPFLFRARLFYGEGRPYLVGVGLDVSERKKARDELEARIEGRTVELVAANRLLRESEERFRALVEASSDLVWELDAKGAYVYVSPKASEMLAYSPAELIGRSPFDFMAPGEAGEARAQFNEAAALKRPFALLESRSIRKDGRVVVLEASGTPIIDQKNNLFGYRGVCRDITARKLEEQEREKLRQQLVQSQKMDAIGALAGGIAHDFNNLMVVIKLNSELAMRRGGANEDIAGFLERINIASERAENLTRQLLIFSRRQPTESRPLSLNRKVENILRLLERVITENICIRTEFDQEVRPVRADKVKIEQVVMNLVLNAKDAMPDGGNITIRTENVEVSGKDSVRAASLGPGAYIRLSVEDTGSGMSGELMGRIFEPFFTTKGPRGTGLGLAVVHEIVKDLKGWIDVESRPGAGTRFEVYLPASEWDGAARDEAPQPVEAAGTGERVLVVEDEKLLRKSVSLVLSRRGYQVFEATSARDAVSLFEKEGGLFDLVFSDMVLEDMDGVKLVEELRRVRGGFKVLMSSGYLDIDTQWPAIRENGFKFLQKPYEVDDLLRSVSEALSR